MTKQRADADDSNPLESELVAYLDGELDAETASRVERRLVDDPTLSERLRGHQRTWDLLDELPRVEVGDEFCRSTVEVVALSASRQVARARWRAARGRLLRRLALGTALLATAAVGYLLTRHILAAPHRRFVRDFPVIDQLDALRHAESIEFLHALANRNLFEGESENGR